MWAYSGLFKCLCIVLESCSLCVHATIKVFSNVCVKKMYILKDYFLKVGLVVWLCLVQPVVIHSSVLAVASHRAP